MVLVNREPLALILNGSATELASVKRFLFRFADGAIWQLSGPARALVGEPGIGGSVNTGTSSG